MKADGLMVMEEPMDHLFAQLLARTAHWNGYEREAALRALLQQAHPDALPAVIVRLNASWAAHRSRTLRLAPRWQDAHAGNRG